MGCFAWRNIEHAKKILCNYFSYVKNRSKLRGLSGKFKIAGAPVGEIIHINSPLKRTTNNV
jgi:hypothetical protein